MFGKFPSRPLLPPVRQGCQRFPFAIMPCEMGVISHAVPQEGYRDAPPILHLAFEGVASLTE